MYRPVHLRTASPAFGSSNRFIARLIGSGLIFFIAGFAHAGSAIWDVDPGSGDWNAATNWTPATVPNGSVDTARFDLSNTTAVSISANTTVDGITFDPGASSFTITAGPGFILTLSGTGITNNSGSAQNFVTAVDAANNHGFIVFENSATAGSGTFFTNSGGRVTFGSGGGVMLFHASSTAGTATITNNGGMVNFQPGGGFTSFSGTSTAANAIITNNGGQVNGAFDGGFTRFLGSSTAGNATITNNAGTAAGAGPGFTEFFDTSTAGSGTFTNNGGAVNLAFGGGNMVFFNASTAANATITNNGAAAMFSDLGGVLKFEGTSTAGSATITNNGGKALGADGARTFFFEASTAANATITNNGGTGFRGATSFGDSSTAGNATLIANGGMGGQGGAIFFENHSTGGTSRVDVFGNGNLDISGHDIRGVTVGSIEGDGDVFLGRRNLTVGSNNLSTTFSGVIQDGGQHGGTGGSLTKIGSGTFDLMGTNTYTGNTYARGGVLQVDGSITSNVFAVGGTLAGTGAVHGNVTNRNHGTVSTGDAPNTLTVDSYTQQRSGTLLIDIAGPNTGQFSVLDVLGNANLGGVLDPVLQNGFIPTIGESFIFMDYSGLTGAFFGIQEPTFNNGLEHWSVTYQPTFAILTAESGPGGPGVTVPDQASTFLLLTLSLLGLSGYRHLLRTQA